MTVVGKTHDAPIFANDKKGSYVRKDSVCRNVISADNESFKPEAGRYHLYISWACPWANRCAMVRVMKGLETTIGLSVVHPTWGKTRPDNPQDSHTGWAFGESGVAKVNVNGYGNVVVNDIKPDTINGCKYVRDLYDLSGAPPTYSVPILWDIKTKSIVNNESSDIVLMLNSAFNEFAEKPNLDLAPVELKASMDDLDSWIYNDINNGVYKCGFARSQEAYDKALKDLENAMGKLDCLLSDRKYVTGERFTMSDIRLFVTLIRFDEVYVVYFKCDSKKVSEYVNIMRYCKDVWKVPGIKETTKMDHIKGHYFTSHPHLNELGIIPKGPNFIGQLEME